MSELRKAIKTLGFPQVADRFVFKSDDDEENIGRVITVLGGLLHVFETHFMALYERTALLNEVEKVTTIFIRSAKSDPNVDAATVNAIADAAREVARTIKSQHRKQLTGRNAAANDSPAQQVMMMRPAVVARSVASSVAFHMSDDELLAAEHGELDQKAMDLIVKVLTRAYVTEPNEETSNVFHLHASTQLRKAIAQRIRKRNLHSKDSHAN